MGAEDTEANRRDIGLREPPSNTAGPLAPSYRPSPSEAADFEAQLQEWQSEGIIERDTTLLVQDP